MRPFKEVFGNKVHFTQIDPGKYNSDELLRAIGNSETDAVIFAGSGFDVTPERERDIFERSAEYIKKPKVWRPCRPRQAPPDLVEELSDLYDWFFFERVLNSRNPKYKGGFHKDWFKQWLRKGKTPPIDRGYQVATLVLNLKFTARLFVRPRKLSKEEVIEVSLNGLKSGKHDMIYFEYSGKYGDPTLVRSVDEARKKAGIDGVLIYGGGINTKEKALEMITAGADAVVVGNVLYKCQKTGDYQPYYDTIKGVRNAEARASHPKVAEVR
jgi:geranylgeranylglyceryl phosphate synthase family protein